MSKMQMQTMDRRKFVELAAVAGATLAAGGVLGGCANSRGEQAADQANDRSQDSAAQTQSDQATTLPADESDAKPVVPGGKSLVAVFSWSGHTLEVAQHINALVESDLFRIEPAQPYTADYNEVLDVAKAEQAAGTLPGIAATVANWDEYSTIYLGWPVWWYEAPQILKAFVRQYNFAGKTVVPFSTSGGSSIESTLDQVQQLAVGATFTKGITLDSDNVTSQLSHVDTWLSGLGLV